ncbi:MAG: EamA family transporter [Cyanobacteria bacterium P01_D01_bin.105]
MAPSTHQRRPTLIGASAVLIWSTLALLTDLSGDIPPFQLTAMAFSIAFGLGVAIQISAGQRPLTGLRLSAPVWALGIGGLFGYHFIYFVALQNAPVIEASLISYLWPLLIVFLSALLPGERLRWFHAAGAISGFLGAFVIITKGRSFAFDSQYATGYLAALGSALIWSSYSVLSRTFGEVPTSAVGGFCGVTAGLAWLCHFVVEQTAVPVGWEWAAIAGLGLGPVGLAFFTWDYGVKHGNIKILGTFSYAAPLLSTLLLIACGLADASSSVLFACLLIVGGALLSMLDVFKPGI